MLGGGEDCHVFTAVFVCLFGGLVNCVKFVIVGGGVSDWNGSDATADTTIQQEICAPACSLPLYCAHRFSSTTKIAGDAKYPFQDVDSSWQGGLGGYD